ncbi:hypothetical protein V8C86DRAFT_2789759 [Haematococcus lacustris]
MAWPRAGVTALIAPPFICSVVARPGPTLLWGRPWGPGAASLAVAAGGVGVLPAWAAAALATPVTGAAVLGTTLLPIAVTHFYHCSVTA